MSRVAGLRRDREAIFSVRSPVEEERRGFFHWISAGFLGLFLFSSWMFSFDVVDGVGALDLERDGLAKTAAPRVDSSAKTRRQIESRFVGKLMV